MAERRGRGPARPGHRLSLAFIFLLSRRCNLQCEYCNVEAGPRVRTRLDPRLFEAWVKSIGALGDIDVGIQLHGGEPLLMNPSVELYSAIARNALAAHPTSRMGSIGVVTNGVLLNRDRARSLVDAGLHVVVSVDGPEHIHDRFRRGASGRPSHRQAMRGVNALRSLGVHPPIIAVVTQPADVLETLRFFGSEGLSRVKINPVRPEGRGIPAPVEDYRARALEMARQYFAAAEEIAAHNIRHPDKPIYEANIHTMMAKVLTGRWTRGGAADWALLVDDTGNLWSHPGGYGVDHMALTSGGPPSSEVLAQALGIPGGGDRASRVAERQRATFRPCEECADPFWCSSFGPLVAGAPGAPVNPDCLWRKELTQLLEAWWQRSPYHASQVVRLDSGARPESPPAPAVGSGDDTISSIDEPLDPRIRSLLQNVRISHDGNAFLANYTDLIVELSGLNVIEDATVFLQLATLASRLADRNDRIGLARSLAHLARVGLVPLSRGAGAGRPRAKTGLESGVTGASLRQ